MANMSYCRFQNTVRDLQDCQDHLDDPDLSEEETKERLRLVRVCRTIAEDYPDDTDLEPYQGNEFPETD